MTATTTTGYSSDIEHTTTGGILSDDVSTTDKKGSPFYSSASNDKLAEELSIGHEVIENKTNANDGKFN
ncbi:unnamed protein product [Didymodactylos carnosus]|uniref:Uncharacterized protein n=1 Tax=Didymodactylos carnosus TaxID=1234261 RepID=A0A8S2UZV5_9BILA|nr:unnamed protein product [Didymodactylos carnosus]CAF4366228.1 unnamed protein product [Didymodactylos carnosus]